jgi:hypothetical protein
MMAEVAAMEIIQNAEVHDLTVDQRRWQKQRCVRMAVAQEHLDNINEDKINDLFNDDDGAADAPMMVSKRPSLHLQNCPPREDGTVHGRRAGDLVGNPRPAGRCRQA